MLGEKRHILNIVLLFQVVVQNGCEAKLKVETERGAFSENAPDDNAGSNPTTTHGGNGVDEDNETTSPQGHDGDGNDDQGDGEALVDGESDSSESLSDGDGVDPGFMEIEFVEPSTHLVSPQVALVEISFSRPLPQEANLKVYGTTADHDCISNIEAWTWLTDIPSDVTSFDWVTNAVTPGQWRFCAHASRSDGSSRYFVANGSVTINSVPTLSVQVAPSVVATGVGVTISVVASDSDNDATIDLYAISNPSDCAADGAGQTSIATGLSENSTESVEWTTTAAGTFLICGRISDGVNPALYVVSEDAVTVNAAPTIENVGPQSPISIPQIGTYAIAFDAEDIDDNASVRLFLSLSSNDCDASLQGWTLVTSGLSEDTDVSWSWTTNSVDPGAWYICAEVDDGVNPPVYAVSGAAVEVNAVPTFEWTDTSNTARLIPTASFSVPFTAADPDSAASITVWLKGSEAGDCSTGTLISATLTEGIDTHFIWDTSGLVTTGIRYLCAEIDDGVNPPLSVHSRQQVVYRNCVWTGATDTLWNNSGNWTDCDGSTPTPQTKVRIPAGPVNQPTLNATASIIGFAPGSGGGTLTIADGVTLQNAYNLDFLIESDVTVQGDASTCSGCTFRFSHSSGSRAQIVEGALLTLGHGLTVIGTGYLAVGNGTTAGHLATVADSGDPDEYPRINPSGTNMWGFQLRGTSSVKSTIEITGMRVFQGYGTAYPLILLQNDWDVLALDSLIVERDYDNGSLIRAQDCASGTFTDTAWTGWQLNMETLPDSGATVRSDADCAGAGPVTISGGGRFYGSVGEHGRDIGDVFSWATDISATCNWTGAVDTDWGNPGNWETCVNGRGGVPDYNDLPTITDTPMNQPTVSDDVVLFSVNEGVAPGEGGTMTVASGSNLQILRVRGPLTIAGNTPTCSDCIVTVSPMNMDVEDGGILSLGSGISVVGGPIHIRQYSGFRTDIASTEPDQWPQVRSLSVWSNNTSIFINGLRFAATSTSGTLFALNGTNGTLENFDKIVFDTGASADDFTGTYINFASLGTWTLLDTSWTGLDFVDGIVGAGHNFFFGSQAGLSAGTVDLTPRVGGVNQGFGSAFTNDGIDFFNWP